MRQGSGYKQVRITLTEQTDREHAGRVLIMYRISVKPLEGDWTLRHVVATGSLRNQERLEDMVDVHQAILAILRGEPLPGHIG